MILDQQLVVPAPVERVWAFITDLPAVARCVPGLESFEAVGADEYDAALTVKVGPFASGVRGRVRVVERDPPSRRLRLVVSGAENPVAGALGGSATVTLLPRGAEETEINIHVEAETPPNIGSFAESIARRKAEEIAHEFGANLSRALAGGPSRD